MEQGPYHSLISVLIIIVLILINGFFTALHTGLISLSHDRLEDLKEKSNKNAESLLRVISNQDRLNQSFSMINSILSLVTVAFIADDLRDWSLLKVNIKLGLFITILLYIVVKVIFVDKIPQRIGVRNPLSFALNTTGLIRLSLALTRPFVKITEIVT